jgi:hypothetical protein
MNLTVQGQQYSFENPQQLEETLTTTFNQFQSRIQELEAAGATPAANDEPKFDNKVFIEKMSQDPIGAMDYADQFRGKEKDQQIETLQNEVQQQNYTMAAYQFKENHPEFMANPQGHQVLRTIMQQNGWDMTYGNLEAALALGQQRGQFPTRAEFNNYVAQQQQAQQAQQQQAQVPDLTPFAQPPQQQQVPPQPNQYPQVPAGAVQNPLQAQFSAPAPPPPQVGGPAAPGVIPANFVEQAENMTPDQLQAAIQSMTAGAPPQI